jgi:glycosyltransferase involved in cell wall biosynthesis
MDPNAGNRPLISVITVSLNNKTGLERTIPSVLSQSYRPVEYLVIDGGSTDGTIELLDRYRDRISRIISEPDNGIYDAMNKGIRLASGEWLNFMNAGDYFYDPLVIETVALQINEAADAIYGNSIADYRHFATVRNTGNPDELWKGMIFSHQSLFVRTSFARAYPFDIDLKKIADFDFVLKASARGMKILKISAPVAVCDTTGISNEDLKTIHAQQYALVRKYLGINFRQKLYHQLNGFYLSGIGVARKMLPSKLYLAMVRQMNRKKCISLSERGNGSFNHPVE